MWVGRRPELEDELLEHLVELRERGSGRAEEIRGALEEIRPGVPHPGVGGSAHRMPAYEERPGQWGEAVHDGRLGAAHVGDEARRRLRPPRTPPPAPGCSGRASRRPPGRRRLPPRPADSAVSVITPLRERCLEGRRIGVVADDLVHLGSFLRGQRQTAAHHPHADDRPADGRRYADGVQPQELSQRLAGPGRRSPGCGPPRAANWSRIERLRPIGQSGLRGRVHLDHEPVGSRGDGGQRQRLHQFDLARGVARVDHDGQVAALLDDGHGRDVERVAGGGLEGADAALAQDDVVVALL